MDILEDRFLGIPNNISGLGEMACNLWRRLASGPCRPWRPTEPMV